MRRVRRCCAGRPDARRSSTGSTALSQRCLPGRLPPGPSPSRTVGVSFWAGGGSSPTGPRRRTRLPARGRSRPGTRHGSLPAALYAPVGGSSPAVGAAVPRSSSQRPDTPSSPRRRATQRTPGENTSSRGPPNSCGTLRIRPAGRRTDGRTYVLDWWKRGSSSP